MTVAVHADVLRFQPERCAALLIFIKCEGYSSEAAQRLAIEIDQSAGESDILRLDRS
jgi:hypothetical protein